MPLLQVRLYRAGDEHSIVEMFASVLGLELSLEAWRWRYQRGPHGPAQIHVLESNGRLVGHMAHLPGSAWVEKRQLRLAYGDGMMILPEYRGRGGAELLLKAFLTSDHGFDIDIAYVNEHSMRARQRHAGTVKLGRALRWVRKHTSRSTFRPIHGPLTLVARSYGGIASWPKRTLLVEDLLSLDPEIDQLAEESAAFAPCVRVRDTAYLRWRWLDQPGANWRLRAARDQEGRLQGYAVFGRRRGHDGDDGRRGSIVDLLATNDLATRSLLLNAFASLVNDGCREVDCIYLDPRRRSRQAMLRSGFVPSVWGPTIACGALTPSAGRTVERRNSWYLTTLDTTG
jgi:hypothetical protein